MEPTTGLTAFFDDRYTTDGAEFETLRKSSIVRDRVLDDGRWVIRSPRPLTEAEVLAVHDRCYLEALGSGDPAGLAGSNGIGWYPNLLEAVLWSGGGVRDAVLEALQERRPTASLSSGLHHARPESGAGYCTINGIAIAVRAALAAGAVRVLVLDLDAHCGGGTVACLEGVAGFEQVDVSTSGYDAYEDTSAAALRISSAGTYLDDVARALDSISRPGTIDVVLYNAGVDPHEASGGAAGITTDTIARREALVFEWAAANDLPVAFTLAGGYRSSRLDLGGIADLHLLAFRAAAQAAGLRAA